MKTCPPHQVNAQQVNNELLRPRTTPARRKRSVDSLNKIGPTRG